MAEESWQPVVGDVVEVQGEILDPAEGYNSSWFPAIVLSVGVRLRDSDDPGVTEGAFKEDPNGHTIGCRVQIKNFDDAPEFCPLDMMRMKPRPPSRAFWALESWAPGDLVDYYFEGGWWEGIVRKAYSQSSQLMVIFPDSPDPQEKTYGKQATPTNGNVNGAAGVLRQSLVWDPYTQVFRPKTPQDLLANSAAAWGKITTGQMGKRAKGKAKAMLEEPGSSAPPGPATVQQQKQEEANKKPKSRKWTAGERATFEQVYIKCKGWNKAEFQKHFPERARSYSLYSYYQDNKVALEEALRTKSPGAGPIPIHQGTGDSPGTSGATRGDVDEEEQADSADEEAGSTDASQERRQGTGGKKQEKRKPREKTWSKWSDAEKLTFRQVFVECGGFNRAELVKHLPARKGSIYAYYNTNKAMLDDVLKTRAPLEQDEGIEAVSSGDEDNRMDGKHFDGCDMEVQAKGSARKKHSNWTKEEKAVFRETVRQYGYQLAIVSKHIPYYDSRRLYQYYYRNKVKLDRISQTKEPGSAPIQILEAPDSTHPTTQHEAGSSGLNTNPSGNISTEVSRRLSIEPQATTTSKKQPAGLPEPRRPGQKRKWTDVERATFQEMIMQHGFDVKLAAEFFPHRDKESIYNYHYRNKAEFDKISKSKIPGSSTILPVISQQKSTAGRSKQAAAEPSSQNLRTKSSLEPRTGSSFRVSGGAGGSDPREGRQEDGGTLGADWLPSHAGRPAGGSGSTPLGQAASLLRLRDSEASFFSTASPTSQPQNKRPVKTASVKDLHEPALLCRSVSAPAAQPQSAVGRRQEMSASRKRDLVFSPKQQLGAKRKPDAGSRLAGARQSQLKISKRAAVASTAQPKTAKVSPGAVSNSDVAIVQVGNIGCVPQDVFEKLMVQICPYVVEGSARVAMEKLRASQEQVYFGWGVVSFRSQQMANKAIRDINSHCLVDSNEAKRWLPRPLRAHIINLEAARLRGRWMPPGRTKPMLLGHVDLHQLVPHFAQPNHMEFDKAKQILATQLQARHVLDALHARHVFQVANLMREAAAKEGRQAKEMDGSLWSLPHTTAKPSCKSVWLRGVGEDVSAKELGDACSQFGSLANVSFPIDPATGQKSGAAIVEMHDERHVINVLDDFRRLMFVCGGTPRPVQADVVYIGAPFRGQEAVWDQAWAQLFPEGTQCRGDGSPTIIRDNIKGWRVMRLNDVDSVSIKLRACLHAQQTEIGAAKALIQHKMSDQSKEVQESIKDAMHMQSRLIAIKHEIHHLLGNGTGQCHK